ncbi:MAG: esterase [Burkholderiaceae bacterium]|nr:esterase [Burkholderiaceae bacterium]
MTTLYLHGFCSTPDSNKGRLLREAHENFGIRFLAPAMHCGPKKASEIIEDTIKDLNSTRLVVIGSSLGGFYATWITEKLGCHAILLNPAVCPWRTINNYLGVHKVTEEIEIEVRPEYVEELKTLNVAKLHNPQNYLTVLGDADEVLDWTMAKEHYAQTQQWIIQGADHRFSNFEELLPRIMKVCQAFA